MQLSDFQVITLSLFALGMYWEVLRCLGVMQVLKAAKYFAVLALAVLAIYIFMGDELQELFEEGSALRAAFIVITVVHVITYIWDVSKFHIKSRTSRSQS